MNTMQKPTTKRKDFNYEVLHKNCAVCGEPFTTWIRTQLTCSPECKLIKKNSDLRRKGFPLFKCPDCGEREQLTFFPYESVAMWEMFFCKKCDYAVIDTIVEEISKVNFLVYTNKKDYSVELRIEKKVTPLEEKTYWSDKYDKCLGCGTTQRKHYGKGLCTVCFQRAVRDNTLKDLPVAEKKWSPHESCCKKCGTTEKKHYRNGFCRGCWRLYQKELFKNFNEEENIWTEKYECCISCGRKDIRHEGKGLCIKCYTKIKRQERNKRLDKE